MTATAVNLTIEGVEGFDRRVMQAMGQALHGLSLDTIQVNIGLRCNLACRHCHVESSPAREESMSWSVMEHVLDAASRCGARTLDITGGAPELHPHLRPFVQAAVARGLHVMVRTNLTIMLEPGYGGLPYFFGEHGVHLIASLPCYLPENVDRQRGRHVYEDSIEVIQRLNHVGYARDADKQLDLVYNPLGASLPPDQAKLEGDYRKVLFDEYDIRFNRLIVITNMAIGRFLHDLERQGRALEYQALLRQSFNDQTLEGLMCRHQIHVGWDGALHDCDFNFALGLPVTTRIRHVSALDPEQVRRRLIRTGEHCFACTAGHGSSCGGALVMN